MDWLSGFQKKPKQVFLVHGETDSKLDFAKLIHDKLGYEPVVIMQNSEFELETGELLSKEDVITDVMDDEKLQQINNLILEIEKASVNLGSSITAEDRDMRPLSEQ